MAANSSTGARKTADRTKAAKAAGAKTDATKLLEQDHREVEKLFAQFEKASAGSRKQAIAAKICMELRVHTQIEEEIFYPATREVLDDEQEEMVDEAVVEHASAKQLIAEIEAMKPSDDLYDAKVKVLQEMIEHHVGEEEEEYFPAVRKTELDLAALGARMQARKSELKARFKPIH